MRKEKCPSIQTCRHAGDDCTAEGAEERDSSCYEANVDPAEAQEPDVEAEKQIALAKEQELHFGDPCIFCGQPHDEVGLGKCPGHSEGMIIQTSADKGTQEQAPVGEGEVTTPFTSDGNSGPYVTPDPDKVSATFLRNLPVDVPDHELADLGTELARQHQLWCRTKLDAKKFAKACKAVTDQAEAEMVRISEVIDAGTEERPTICQWEFHYNEGVKKLRRLDNHQIVAEETLTGDEVHMSFNFDQTNGEDNVAKFFEKTTTAKETCPVCNDSGFYTAEGAGKNAPEPYCKCPVGRDMREKVCASCDLDKDACVGCIAYDPTEETADQQPEQDATEAVQQGPAPETETPAPSAYVCKVCGVDAGSHIYLVRHLRDDHNMKLSDYKKQFPVKG